MAGFRPDHFEGIGVYSPRCYARAKGKCALPWSACAGDPAVATPPDRGAWTPPPPGVRTDLRVLHLFTFHLPSSTRPAAKRWWIPTRTGNDAATVRARPLAFFAQPPPSPAGSNGSGGGIAVISSAGQRAGSVHSPAGGPVARWLPLLRRDAPLHSRKEISKARCAPQMPGLGPRTVKSTRGKVIHRFRHRRVEGGGATANAPWSFL